MLIIKCSFRVSCAEQNTCNMNWRSLPLLFLPAFTLSVHAQDEDSVNTERLAKMVNLSEVIIRSDLNVARFIDQVKNDTTFYKAFRNLRVLGFTAWNDIR